MSASRKKLRAMRSTVEVQPEPESRWNIIRPWIALVLRVGLAAVALWAGIAKVQDFDGSIRAVAAYQILPDALVDVVGYGLPVVEIMLGLILLIGIFTRYAAAVNGLIMLAFIIGIASVWARGMKIDCGCFGGGGPSDSVNAATYLLEIARDVGLLACSAFLVVWPRSKFSLDRALDID